jgi:hypothetical protein
VEEAVMSLSAREQQALDSIEDRLADSDPNLASLMATFTRLASGREMPRQERIRATGGRHRRRWCRGHGRAGWPAPNIRFGWQGDMAVFLLVLVLVAAMALAAASLAANRGGKGTCNAPWMAACAGQAPGHGSRTAAHAMPLGLMMPTSGDSRFVPPPVPVSTGFR